MLSTALSVFPKVPPMNPKSIHRAIPFSGTSKDLGGRSSIRRSRKRRAGSMILNVDFVCENCQTMTVAYPNAIGGVCVSGGLGPTSIPKSDLDLGTSSLLVEVPVPVRVDRIVESRISVRRNRLGKCCCHEKESQKTNNEYEQNFTHSASQGRRSPSPTRAGNLHFCGGASFLPGQRIRPSGTVSSMRERRPQRRSRLSGAHFDIGGA